MNLTKDEWTMIRKALQYASNAHLSVEVYDGKEYRDTKTEALIRKIREFEEGAENGNDGTDKEEG